MRRKTNGNKNKFILHQNFFWIVTGCAFLIYLLVLGTIGLFQQFWNPNYVEFGPEIRFHHAEPCANRYMPKAAEDCLILGQKVSLNTKRPRTLSQGIQAVINSFSKKSQSMISSSTPESWECSLNGNLVEIKTHQMRIGDIYKCWPK